MNITLNSLYLIELKKTKIDFNKLYEEYFFLSLGFIIVTSCNLKERIQKAEKIRTELITEFNHQKINSSYNIGTEENDNYFQVDFYEYPLSQKTHLELEIIANKVNTFIKRKKPEYESLDFIEIRFTKSKKENIVSFVNFIFK